MLDKFTKCYWKRLNMSKCGLVLHSLNCNRTIISFLGIFTFRQNSISNRMKILRKKEYCYYRVGETLRS